MTQDLRFTGTTLTSSDSDVSSDRTLNWGKLSNSSGISNTNPSKQC